MLSIAKQLTERPLAALRATGLVCQSHDVWFRIEKEVSSSPRNLNSLFKLRRFAAFRAQTSRGDFLIVRE